MKSADAIPASSGPTPAPQQLPLNKNQCCSPNLIKLQKAHSFFARAKGLLGSQRLEYGQGLWILPCRSIHTFGMRYAIDVIFLDGSLQIIQTVDAVPPDRVIWQPRAASVVELAANSLVRLDLEPFMSMEQYDENHFLFVPKR
jgi:uncharacterized protein